MTYSAVYCSLISKRLQNQLPKVEYGENHHIIPKSEGGDNDKSNLVRLSAREHYVAHLLLARIYDDKKMWCALNRLVHGNDFKKYQHVSSRMYQNLKTNYAKFNDGGREKNTGKKRTPEQKERIRQAKLGAKNPMFGKKHSAEARQNLSDSLKGHVGYWRGKKQDKQTVDKRSTAIRGKKHWNNGIIDLFSVECPEGFVRGKLHKIIAWNRGMKK